MDLGRGGEYDPHTLYKIHKQLMKKYKEFHCCVFVGHFGVTFFFFVKTERERLRSWMNREVEVWKELAEVKT